MLDQTRLSLAAQADLQLTALDRDLGKQRNVHATEQNRVRDATDELENLKAALIAAMRALKQQNASCNAVR